MSRVFISHSGRDSAWALAVQRWLIGQQPDLAGEIFFDIDPEDGIRAGQRWKDALRAAGERCEAVVCLVSRNWLSSKECEAEYRVAEYLGKQIYCARIEHLDGAEDITREWQRCDLYGDGPQTEIDIGSGGEPLVVRTAGLQKLLTGLRGAGIGSDHFPWPPTDEPDRAPYRGWVSFEPQDAAVFFGRDGQILRAMDELRKMRISKIRALFVVVGASGTGKSSFLRAGLIPRLQRDDRHFLVLDIMRPERGALTGAHGLAAVIHTTRRRMGLPTPVLGDIKAALTIGDVAQLRDWLLELQQSARRRLVDEGAEAGTLVLPIDQAEELLSTDAGPEGTGILKLLSDLLSTPAGEERLPLIVAATIRTDRYHSWQSNPQLANIDTEMFDNLKPMPRDRFRDIITGPARRSSRHLEIGPDLIDQLLDDCGDGADTLPMLSLTLAALYRDYGTTGRLTSAQYTAIGGIANVLTTEIDRILDPDPRTREHQLDLLRSAFVPWLASMVPDTDEPLRRIARYSDLPTEARPLIDKFVERRLLVADHDGTATTIEIALESLLRQWDDLAGWLRDHSDDLKHVAAIEHAAAEWERNQRDPAWLVEGSRLTDAEHLASKPDYRARLSSAARFLAACRARADDRIDAEKRRRDDELRVARAHAAAMRKRAKQLMAAALAAVLAALVAGTGAVVAVTYQHRAVQNEKHAVAQQLIAEGRAMLTGNQPGDDTRGLKQILAAHTLEHGHDTDNAVAAALYTTVALQHIYPLPTPSPSGTAISTDGHRLAATYDDGIVRVWNVSDHAPTRLEAEIRSPSPGPFTQALTFDPTGHRLAASFLNGSVRVWDVSDHGRTQLGPDLIAPNSPLTQLTFDPTGHRLATGYANGTVRVWDVGGPNVSQLGLLTNLGTRLSQLAFDAAGHRLAASYNNSTVRVWEVSDQGLTQIGPDLVDLGDPLERLAFDPTGQRLATGYANGTVRVWAIGDHGLTQLGPALTIPGGPVVQLVFDRTGHRLATSHSNNTVRVWDVGDQELTQLGPDLINSGVSLRQLVFDPDGRRLAASYDNGAVRVWEVGDDVLTQDGPDLANPGTPVQQLIFDPTSNSIETLCVDGTLRIWRIPHWSPLLPHATNLSGDTVDMVNHLLAGEYDDHTIRIWKLGDYGPTQLGPDLTAIGDLFSQQLVFDQSGHRLAVGAIDGTVRAWDIGDDSVTRLGPDLTSPGTTVRQLVFDSTGHRLAASYNNGSMRVWEIGDHGLTQLRPDPTVSGNPLSLQLIFDSSGDRLAASYVDGTVRVWNAGERGLTQLRPDLTSKSIFPAQLAFAASGHRLAIGSANSLQIWDVSNRNPTELVSNSPNFNVSTYVQQLTFDPTGQRLAAGYGNGTVQIWDVGDHKLTQFGPDLRNPGTLLTQLVFDTTGTRLATGYDIGSVRIWDMGGHGPTQLGPDLASPGTPVQQLVFDRKRHLVAVAGGNVMKWLDYTSDDGQICAKLDSGISPEEWRKWISSDLDPQDPCQNSKGH